MTNEEQTKKILEKSIRQGFIQGKCSEIISEINALRQRYYEMCLNCTKHTSSDYCEACRMWHLTSKPFVGTHRRKKGLKRLHK